MCVRKVKVKDRTYGRNLLGKVNVLGQLHRALLQRALEIDILEVLTQVGLLVDDADQTVLDLQVNLCALLDILRQDSRGLDGQSDATANKRELGRSR